MQRLLELPNGAIDFNAVNKRGQTGMAVAKEQGHTAVVKVLAKAGLAS